MNKKINIDYDIIGIDFGDGETAISWCKSSTRTAPQMLEIAAQKRILSAVCTLKDGDYIIGEDACQCANPIELHLRFKHEFILNNSNAKVNIIRFASKLRTKLIESGKLRDPDKTKIVIGCPSGFSIQKRKDYISLFKQAGFINITLVNESRAAFLFSRESGELRVTENLLYKPTLIIDAGSSTTDFTYVNGLKEHFIKATDFGENRLGAGLIDEMLCDLNIDRHKQSKKIKEILEQFPIYEARLEFESRRVKEMYFSRFAHKSILMTAESSVKLYCTKTPLNVDIQCNDNDMNRILNTPITTLGNLSYLDACRQSVENAKTNIPGNNIELILLTGGASRMYIWADIIKEYFPNATIVMGNEPEFAISRGLSYAERLDLRTQGFENDVETFISSDKINTIVLNQLNLLFKTISKPIVKKISNEIVIPTFKEWQNGVYETINDMILATKEKASALFKTSDFSKFIAPYTEKQFEISAQYIEAATVPICDKYSLPHTTFKFSKDIIIDEDAFSISLDSLFNFNVFMTIIDIVIATISASLMGGVETALIASGPLGLVIGAVLGLGVGIVGTKLLEKKLREAVLPIYIRKTLFRKKRIEQQLEKKSDDMADEVYKNLHDSLNNQSPSMNKLSEYLLKNIKYQMIEMKERASLIIR